MFPKDLLEVTNHPRHAVDVGLERDNRCVAVVGDYALVALPRNFRRMDAEVRICFRLEFSDSHHGLLS